MGEREKQKKLFTVEEATEILRKMRPRSLLKIGLEMQYAEMYWATACLVASVECATEEDLMAKAPYLLAAQSSKEAICESPFLEAYRRLVRQAIEGTIEGGGSVEALISAQLPWDNAGLRAAVRILVISRAPAEVKQLIARRENLPTEAEVGGANQLIKQYNIKELFVAKLIGI